MSSRSASPSRLPAGFALLLAGCPPPIATEDTGDAPTGSSSTTSPGDSASDTGATPTSRPDPTSTGTVPDTASTTGTTGTTLGVDTTTGDTTTSQTTSTGDASTSSTSSTTGPVEPPPGCDVAVVHVGELVITDDTAMADLQCIVEVTGRLTINGTQTLVSFAALANLERVGDDIQVFDNLALEDLDGFAALERVDGEMYGELVVHHNPALTDLTGLKSLKQVDTVLISDCDALTDLTGLTGTLEGVFGVPSLAISDCDGLTNLDGLTGLTDLTGSIFIHGNTQLTDIDALSTVLSPTIEQISIDGNSALQDLQGLDLVVASKSVLVTNNDILVDLTGLDSLQKVGPGFLFIEGNAQLVSLDGLGALDTVTDLSIEDNPALTSLAGLASLTHVTGGMTLGRCGEQGNDGLVDLHGLENLVEMQYISLNENDALQSIAALPADIGIGGIIAFNNPQLSNAAIADYVADAGIGQKSHLCNNGGAPAVCECIVLTD